MAAPTQRRSAAAAAAGPPGAPHRLLGVAFILIASIGFSGMGLLTKLALSGGERIGFWPVVFGRSLVPAVVALALLARARTPLRPGHPRLLALRSVLGVCGMLLFFGALAAIPLGTATTLLYTSPLFTVLLAAPLLGERLERRTLPLALVAFAGVALIVQPTAADLDLGVLLALGAGLVSALVYLTVRGLRSSDPPSRIVFWFSLFATLVSAGPAFAAGMPTRPADVALVLAIGACATLGQLTMTLAYRYERASIVGPFSYATVVVSWALGLAFLDEQLDAAGLAGMGCVVAAGAILGRSARAEAPTPPGAAAVTKPS